MVSVACASYASPPQLLVVVDVARGKFAAFDEKHFNSKQHYGHSDKCYGEQYGQEYFHCQIRFSSAKVTIYLKLLCLYQFYFII